MRRATPLGSGPEAAHRYGRDGRGASGAAGDIGPRGARDALLHAMCKAKIHRATVTEANLDYEGSITIDRSLIDAVGILPYEIVQITNLANGALWRTYVIPGPAQSGVFCLNGPPARHFHPGDCAVVVSHGYCAEAELGAWVQRTAFVDERNRLERVEEHRVL